MTNHEFLTFINEIKEGSILSNESIETLNKIFNDKMVSNVIEIIKHKKIECYEIEGTNIRIWLVNGRNEKYFVIPLEYCSCVNFYINGIMKKRPYLCKHLISQSLYEKIHKNDVPTKDTINNIVDLAFS